MSKPFQRASKYALTVAIFVSSLAITGCAESTFTLASESRLPKSMTLPPGIPRKDVSVTLEFSTPLRGPNAKFILKDRKGKKLAEIKGKTEGGSGCSEIITEKGTTETVRLEPYRQHENMEQNGRAVALFYIDDCY